MAVAVGGASVIARSYTSPATASKTVPTGSNRYLLAAVFWRDSVSRTVSGVTFGGANLTQISGARLEVADPVGVLGVDLWGLVAPSQTTANVIATIPSMSDTMWVVATDFVGVDQTISLGTPATATQVNSATATDTIAIASGNMGFSALTCHWSGSTANPTAGQTQEAKLDDGFGGVSAAASSGAGSLSSMTWSGLFGSFGNAYAMSAVELKASGGTVTVNSNFFQFMGT